MFRSAASILAKKTAIVAITGVAVIGGATLALAEVDVTDIVGDDSSAGESTLVLEPGNEVSDPVCPGDEGTDSTDGSTDGDDTATGDDSTQSTDGDDTATGDDSTQSTDGDDTATGDEGTDSTDGDDTATGDEGTDSTDCEGGEVAGSTGDDGVDGDNGSGGEIAGGEGTEDEGDLDDDEDLQGDLPDDETEGGEVAEGNHGAAVSKAAKDCKTELGGAKNHGQCVAAVATRGKKAPAEEPAATPVPPAEDTTAEEPTDVTDMTDVTDVTDVTDAPAEKAGASTPAPPENGKPVKSNNAGGNGKGKG
jgi:hypothetical protein